MSGMEGFPPPKKIAQEKAPNEGAQLSHVSEVVVPQEPPASSENVAPEQEPTKDSGARRESAPMERETLLRREYANISENSNRLVAVMRQRSGNSLPPLMDDTALGRLSVGARSLAEHGSVHDSRKAVEGINALTSAIGSYGNVPSRGPVRENMDSLKRVSFALREFSETAQNAALRAGTRREEMPDEYAALARLAKTSNGAYTAHLRRIGALQRYLGR